MEFIKEVIIWLVVKEKAERKNNYRLHRIDDISLYIEVINQHKALVYSMEFIRGG